MPSKPTVSRDAQDRSVRSTGPRTAAGFAARGPCAALLAGLALVVAIGCTDHVASPPNADAEVTIVERPFAEQLAEVIAGNGSKIVVEREAIRPEEFARLSAAAGLVELRLPLTPAVDEQALLLAKLPALEVIALGNTAWTDAAVESLASLAGLRQFNVNDSQIGDAGLAALARFEQLELLRLGSRQISDAGLRSLESHARLRFLILRHAPIGDASLRTLARIESLESLYLEDTRVTEAGLAWLHDERPRLHVHCP